MREDAVKAAMEELTKNHIKAIANVRRSLLTLVYVFKRDLFYGFNRRAGGGVRAHCTLYLLITYQVLVALFSFQLNSYCRRFYCVLCGILDKPWSQAGRYRARPESASMMIGLSTQVVLESKTSFTAGVSRRFCLKQNTRVSDEP